jgi:hypothetical protein
MVEEKKMHVFLAFPHLIVITRMTIITLFRLDENVGATLGNVTISATDVSTPL